MKSEKPDFTDDPYWGKGGSYVVDPVTGKRSPAPAPTVDADPAPAAEADPDPAKTLKEKRRG